jgi:molybdopterin synthase catalytic subunit
LSEAISISAAQFFGENCFDDGESTLSTKLQRMIKLTGESIDLSTLLPLVSHPDCGAQVMFVGTTRQWTGDVETEYLEYEAYEQLAIVKMNELEATARSRWPLKEVVMVHRIGRVDVAQPSVAVLVASPHRTEAFEAAKWLIDELKHQVPIWKQEHYVQVCADRQSSQWIHPSAGSCNCDSHTSSKSAQQQQAAQQ